MRVEGATREADIGGPILAEAPHQFASSANDADRQPATQRLAVGHHIGLHAEIVLCTTARDPEADEHLVKNQHDTALAADLPKFSQPFRIGHAIETRATRPVHQRRIARRIRVRMQRLERVHQNAGDILSRAKDLQRLFRHIAERIGVIGGNRIADAGLHVAPPSVIGAAQANKMRPLRVVACKTNRLHHRLGSGHVERDLVETGNLFQAPDVIDNHRMIAAQYGTEIAHPLGALGDAVLVEIVAEDVDAIRSGQIVEAVAVEISHHHAVGRLQERSAFQIVPHDTAELKRHTVPRGELQIGNAVCCLGREICGLRKMRPIVICEPAESRPAARDHIVRGLIGSKERRLLVLVERNEGGQPSRDTRMPLERSVLGARQRKARSDFGKKRNQCRSTGGIECDGGV